MATRTLAAAAPVVAPADSGYFESGEDAFLVQGCAVTRPALIDEDGMRQLAEHGATTVRIWSDYYERGQVDVEAFQRTRAWAEEYGLRILLVLHSPVFLSDIYEGTSRFDHGLTVFNAICDRATDVPTSPAAEEALVERCRTILSIFEDSPTLIGWEVVNQSDDLYEIDNVTMADFIRRLAERVRAEDRKVGVPRLITGSSFQPIPPDWILDLDELDFIALHPYAESVEYPKNRIDGAVHVGAAVRYALERSTRMRPVQDTESGVIGQLYLAASPRPDIAFRSELAHNLRWAHLASGGAGTGLHVAVNDEGMTADRRVPHSRLRWVPLSGELADIDAISRFWALAPGRGAVRNLGDDLRVRTPGTFGFASATSDRVVGWLLRDTRASDLAADIERALAAGPTLPGTFDLRLQAIDSWREALDRLSLDPYNYSSRKAVGMLLSRGPGGMRRACELIDEGLDHLLAVTRRVTPWVLDATAPAAAPVEVEVSGLEPRGYELSWFDDVEGTVVATDAVRGPTVRATSPPFERHLAFLLVPASEATAGNGGPPA